MLDPTSDGSNVWPDVRDPAKCAVMMTPIHCPRISNDIRPELLHCLDYDPRLSRLQERAKSAFKQQEIIVRKIVFAINFFQEKPADPSCSSIETCQQV
jgi:hypothetical protein